MSIKRDFLGKNEGSLTILQMAGFMLLLLGVISLIISSFFKPDIFPSIPSIISISFFITMLGFSFAFPSLLEGNEGLSTMRIVVFMVTNVICMLLLKVGWAAGVKSLTDIGLNQYWMGVIAFVFGAKATQSFFESRMARNTSDTTNNSSIESTPIASADILAEAIKEKGKEWIDSFPYTTGLSVRNKISNGKELKDVVLTFKVTKKLEKLDFGSIPESLYYVGKDGIKYRILTDVLEEDMPSGNGGTIIDQEPFPIGNSISRENDICTGSIGLVVSKNNDDNDYIVSCFHVFCAPELRKNNKTYDGKNNSNRLSCASFKDDGTNDVGYVVEGKMDIENDFAVGIVRKGIKVDNGKLTLGIVPMSFGFVFPENKGDILTICGRTSGISKGKIKSHSASQTISYFRSTVSQYIHGLIEVEKFSEGGDSGTVAINEKNEIIGLIVAGNTDSSYILPIQDFLIQNNYSLKI